MKATRLHQYGSPGEHTPAMGGVGGAGGLHGAEGWRDGAHTPTSRKAP